MDEPTMTCPRLFGRRFLKRLLESNSRLSLPRGLATRMRSSRFVPYPEDCYTLFPQEAIAPLPKKRTFKRVEHPIWSHNKARFIAQYLKYFVQITKHGAYIDGFAGPQYPDHL